MKKTILLCWALLLCFGLAGCAKWQAALQQQATPADTVVAVGLQQPAEFCVLDGALLTAAEHCTWQLAKEEEEQYQLLATAAQDPTTAVLVAELRSRGYAPRLIELAQSHGLPLVLCGARPSLRVLDDYDNCWYIGFDAALAVERQAQILVAAHQAGLLQDQDGDFKQTALCVVSLPGLERQTDAYADKLLQEIEVGGIHVAAAAQPVYGMDAETLRQRLQEQLLPWQEGFEEQLEIDGETVTETYYEPHPPRAATEIFLCGDVLAAEAALATVDILNTAPEDGELAAFATPARRYSLACFGTSEAIAAAMAEGTVLGTVCYDTQAAADALLALCGNLLRQESPTKDTDYHLQDGKYILLDYRVQLADFAALAARAQGPTDGADTAEPQEDDEGAEDETVQR